MQPTPSCDIAIIGGGLVGASLALALQPLIERRKAQGQALKVCLIESHPPALDQQPDGRWQPSFDARSSALSWGTRLIYEQLGLWAALQQHAYPIKHIHVSERGHFGSVHLDHQEQQVAALGYVVPNTWLGQVLWQALQQAANTELLAPVTVSSVTFPDAATALLQGEMQGQPWQLQSNLLVLADGGRSGLKQQLGITDQVHDYQQTALIANLRLSKPHQGWAYERFATDGPMALLPLAGRDMALVWTRTGEQAPRDASLPEAEFLARLQRSFGKRAGRFQQVGERFAYPLKKIRATEQVRRNLVVLGNAAHYLHPVAGQGYNLAIRGVMALAQALDTAAIEATATGQSFHPGALPPLELWQARRMQDQDEVIGFSHGLVSLFGQSLPLLGHARASGLCGLNLVAPLRRWLATRAMGL